MIDFLDEHKQRYEQNKDDGIYELTYEGIIEELRQNISLLDKGEVYHVLLGEGSGYYPCLAFVVIEENNNILLVDFVISGY